MDKISSRQYKTGQGTALVEFITQSSGLCRFHISLGDQQWWETSQFWLAQHFPYVYADVLTNPVDGWQLHQTDKAVVHVFHHLPGDMPSPFVWVASVAADSINDAITKTSSSGQWWLEYFEDCVVAPLARRTRCNDLLFCNNQWYMVGTTAIAGGKLKPVQIDVPDLPFIRDATYRQAINLLTVYWHVLEIERQPLIAQIYKIAEILNRYTAVFGWQL